jgi:hypothetical protein
VNYQVLVEKSGHFANLVNPQEPGVLASEIFSKAAGCSTAPIGHPEWRDEQFPAGKGLWPRFCMYSKIVRSLIIGGATKRLKDETSWLKRYFVGDNLRFDAVMSVNKEGPHIYDSVVHLRTRWLIEADRSNGFGAAIDPEGKSKVFMASHAFQSMIDCIAADIYNGIKIDTAHFQSTLIPRAGGKPKIAAVYLATDSTHIHESLAQRLKLALDSLLPNGWLAEIDYMRHDLPPAHWSVWTKPNDALTTEQWQQLVGTTAEWLFVTQGRRMVTIRGITGGELNDPSSFSTSAAAFGRATSVTYLRGSAGDNANGTLRCKWVTIAYFGPQPE